MRVTQRMVSQGIKSNLARRSSKLEAAHRRMSEGVQVYRPSDDPGAMSRILALRSLVRDVEDRRFQAEANLNVLTSADDAMGEANDIMQEVRQIALNSVSGTVSDNDRMTSLGMQVSEYLDQVRLVADRQFDDRQLFYDVDNTGGATGTLGLGLSREAVFGKAISSLESLVGELQSGDGASEQTLEALKQGLDTIVNFRTQVGARANRFEGVKNRLLELEQDLRQRKAAEEEVDLSKAVIDMKQEEAAYQAALSATARIMQVSLVDFL